MGKMEGTYGGLSITRPQSSDPHNNNHSSLHSQGLAINIVYGE